MWPVSVWCYVWLTGFRDTGKWRGTVSGVTWTDKAACRTSGVVPLPFRADNGALGGYSGPEIPLGAQNPVSGEFG
jgi:hypothetical protein